MLFRSGLLAALIRDACHQPLALLLEGGYGPSLGDAIACILAVLKEGRTPEIPHVPERESTRRTARLLKRVMI